MTSLDYNSDALFDLLPSFWRSYPDRQVLEAVYEAYLRLADTDYSALFTLDANKDLTTLQSTRTQPLMYQRFDAWEALRSKHSHIYLDMLWPTEQNGRHVLRIPDIVLSSNTLIFANNTLLPSFLYVIKEDWWIESGQLSRGSVVVFSRERLSKYFLERKLDSSICFTVSSATGTIDFSLIKLISFGHKTIISERGDANTTAYSFDGTYDLHGSSIRAEFWEISRKATITYSQGVASIQIPAPTATGGRGYAALSDDSVVAINVLPTFNVSVGDLRIVGIYLYLDFNLRTKLTLDKLGVSATDGYFPAGMEISVRAGGSVSSVVPSIATERISVPCSPNSVGAEVIAFGTNLTNFRVEPAVNRRMPCGKLLDVDQRIIFDRPITEQLILKISIAQEEEHSHARLVLPAPYSLEELDLGVDIENKDSVLVFARGRYLIEELDYFWYSDTALLFSDVFRSGDIVTIFYETSEALGHSHTTQSFVGNGQTNTPLNDGVLVDEPAMLFADSILLSTVQAQLSTDTGISFRTPASNRIRYTFIGSTNGWAFRHPLPLIEETDWGYVGRLVSAESLADGITHVTTSLSSDEFFIDTSVTPPMLYTNVRLDEGWWINASIDERALQSSWGALVGFDGSSTDIYARILGAIVGAARASSSKNTIENFGSYLFGSALVPKVGKYGGLQSGNTEVKITTYDPFMDDVILPVLAYAPMALPTQGCIEANTAVNSVVRVIDLLREPPTWLPIFAETLSDTFNAAKRLDKYSVKQVSSTPYSYSGSSKLLVDYSLDFIESGLAAGDLVKVTYGHVQDSFVVTPEIPSVGFATIIEVISEHKLLIDIPQMAELISYGEGPFGEGVYGGSTTTESRIARYTVWIRDRERLDTRTYVDALDVSSLNKLAQVLSAFSFGVEVNWGAVTDKQLMAGLGRMLDITKPADTKVFVFTKAFEDLHSSSLAERATYAIEDQAPIRAGIPNALFMEQSFIGASSVYTTDSIYGHLFTAEPLRYGPDVLLILAQESSRVSVGDYVITHSTVAEDSRFYQTYSTERGLENTLLRVGAGTVPDVAYTGGVLNGDYDVQGISLSDIGYITVDTASGTGFLQETSIPLTYEEGQEFTLNLWIKMDSDRHSPGDTPTIFSWGSIVVDLLYVSSSSYALRCTTYNGTPLVSTIRVLSGKTNMITLTYGLVEGETYYQTKIYVNGVLAATSTDTADTEIAAITAAITIGSDAAHTVGTFFKGGLLLIDLKNRVYTAEQILTLYAAGRGVFPTLGIDVDGAPLRLPDAWITYQFHNYWPTPTVPDYSGNAFNATVTGDITYVSGSLKTNAPSAGVCFLILESTIDSSGLRIPTPRFSANTAVVSSGDGFILPNGAFVGGAAALDDKLITLTRSGVTYSVPNIAYCAQQDGSWAAFSPDIVIPTSSIDVDDSQLYAGFSI